MKTYKRSGLIVVLFLMVCIGYGQQGGQRQRMSPEERAKQNTEWMTKELKLDDKTARKVDEINLKYAKKQQEEVQTIMQSGDRSQMREIMQKMNDAKNKELKPVLGDKKYEQYLKILEERRQNRQQGPRGV